MWFKEALTPHRIPWYTASCSFKKYNCLLLRFLGSFPFLSFIWIFYYFISTFYYFISTVPVLINLDSTPRSFSFAHGLTCKEDLVGDFWEFIGNLLLQTHWYLQQACFTNLQLHWEKPLLISAAHLKLARDTSHHTVWAILNFSCSQVFQAN